MAKFYVRNGNEGLVEMPVVPGQGGSFSTDNIANDIDTTNPLKVLSAKQGKVLNDRLEALENAPETYSKAELDVELKAIQDSIDNLEISGDITLGDVANKFGAAYYSVDDTTLYYFRNDEEKQAWISAGCPKTSLYIMDSTIFEFSSKQYQINLTNNNGSNILYFTNDSIEALISLLPTTKCKALTDNDWVSFTEDYTISVQYDKQMYCFKC